MSSKPFIHPDILVTIKQNLTKETDDRLESDLFDNARQSGEAFANVILSSLSTAFIEHGEVKSHFNTNRLTSERLMGVREQIVSMHYQRKALQAELADYLRKERELSTKLSKLQRSLISFLYKKRIIRFIEELNVLKSKIRSLSDVTIESYVNLRFEFENDNVRNSYSDLTSAFTTLKSTQKIWDVVMTQLNLDTKAAAGTNIERNEVKIDFKGVEVLNTENKVLHIENYNGGDFYLYPSFIIYFKNNDEIALIDYCDLYIIYNKQEFLEERNNIPSDTTIIGETWYRVNRDGSPDRRFASNYKIPIVHYGSLHFKTASGVNELYYISDVKKAEHFVTQFNLYQSMIRGFK